MGQVEIRMRTKMMSGGKCGKIYFLGKTRQDGKLCKMGTFLPKILIRSQMQWAYFKHLMLGCPLCGIQDGKLRLLHEAVKDKTG